MSLTKIGTRRQSQSKLLPIDINITAATIINVTANPDLNDSNSDQTFVSLQATDQVNISRRYITIT